MKEISKRQSSYKTTYVNISDSRDYQEELQNEVVQNLDILDSLSEQISTPSMLGGDLSLSISSMNKLVKIQTSNLKQLNNSLELAANFTVKMAETVSKVMQTTTRINESESGWFDLPTKERAQTAEVIMDTMDETGFLLADALATKAEIENNNSTDKNSKFLSVHRALENTAFQVAGTVYYGGNITFPKKGETIPDKHWGAETGQITLPLDDSLEKSTIVFAVYNNLDQLLDTNVEPALSEIEQELDTHLNSTSATPLTIDDLTSSVVIDEKFDNSTSPEELYKLCLIEKSVPKLCDDLKPLEPKSNTKRILAATAVKNSQNDSDFVINSHVISASVRPSKALIKEKGVKIVLRHRKPTFGKHLGQCVYWEKFKTTVDSVSEGNKKYKTSGKASGGFWSTRGCKTLSSNQTHTECLCTHLTNFAILMDVYGVELDEQHELYLDWITKIGCTISLVCLILACICFLCLPGVANLMRTKIHFNLCLNLICAQTIILTLLKSAKNHVFWCGISAAMLHFFYLTAFFWMSIEGLHLYISLVKVFTVDSKSTIRWYAFFAYSIPLIIVISTYSKGKVKDIDASLGHYIYGSIGQHCWINAENSSRLLFVVPVMVICSFNMFFLLVALKVVGQHRRAALKRKPIRSQYNSTGSSSTASSKISKHIGVHTGKASLKIVSGKGKLDHLQMNIQKQLSQAATTAKGSVVLICLLGVTWIIGIFYVSQGTVFFAYAFTVINSLQGFFIFLFHCTLNEKVRLAFIKRFKPNIPERYKSWARFSNWSSSGTTKTDLSSGYSTSELASNNSVDKKKKNSIVGTGYRNKMEGVNSELVKRKFTPVKPKWTEQQKVFTGKNKNGRKISLKAIDSVNVGFDFSTIREKVVAFSPRMSFTKDSESSSIGERCNRAFESERDESGTGSLEGSSDL